LPIIYNIYKTKKEEDIFILSCGHAGLALYVTLEHFYGYDAEELFKKHGVHPNRDIDKKIFCSTGSLGLGLPISIGFAIGSLDREVFCLISDGECAEGSIWESLRYITESNLKNITVLVNANGFSALDKIDLNYLSDRLKAFYKDIIIINSPSSFDGIPDGLEAHYHILTKEDYETAISKITV
jgi:transketolase